MMLRRYWALIVFFVLALTNVSSARADNCLGIVKQQAVGSTVSVSGKVVTGVFAGYFYIQDTEVGHLSCGIKVVSQIVPSVGSLVTVNGVLAKDINDELVINATSALVSGNSQLPQAIGCNNRDIGGGTQGAAQGPDGGSGVNMVGVLQTTWGKVSELVPTKSMIIDDGSGTPVKVVGPIHYVENGDFVRVTGIASIEKNGDAHTRVLRIRNADDVATIGVTRPHKDPIISLSAADLPSGVLSVWQNDGSLGGVFSYEVTKLSTGKYAGRKYVLFSGTNRMKSNFVAPDSIGGNGQWTVLVWALNPAIGVDECILSWARRGGQDGTGAQINFGSSVTSGATYHGGVTDMPFLDLPVPGMWQHIAVTFDGSVERLYLNGVLCNQENKTLSIYKNMPFYLGCGYRLSGSTYAAECPYSGAIASIRVYDYALSAGEVSAIAESEADPIVSLDAGRLAEGSLSSWANNGRLGGAFYSELGVPVVENIGRLKGATFDGADWLRSTFIVPTSITGNGQWSVHMRVYNPEFAAEEAVVSWAARGGEYGTNAQINYGNSPISGAVAHGGALDMGFGTSQPSAGVWQMVTVTFDGITERIYVNGKSGPTEDKTLNITPGFPMFLGSAFAYDGTAFIPTVFFSGSINQLKVFDRVLSATEIQNLYSTSLTKVMPLGDSITDGYNVPGGYRIKLWNDVISAGLHLDYVGSQSNSSLPDPDHEGHPGWIISQIDANINTWMDTYRPDIVLLHIGTNDINLNVDVPNAPYRLSGLVDKILAKLPENGKVFVAKIVPTTYGTPSNDPKIVEYNNAIADLMLQKQLQGKPVYVVDMYSALTYADLADGIHPTQTGYDKMGDVWFNAICSYLKW